MATLPVGDRSNYTTVFERQSIDDFIRQANKIAKCNKKLIWEKKSLEPVVDKRKFNRIKYITDSDESSKVAMIWAQVYTDKIIQKSEHLSLSPTEISLFKNVRETFQSILSPASKNDAMKNYKEAGNAFDSLLYKIQEQMPGEQLRIWNKNAADKAKIREMMQREKRSSPAVGMDGEKHVERVEDVSGDEEISERESDEVKPEFQASKLKLSPNKCSKLTKVICSVSVVVAAILMMLYKYNE